MFETFLFDLEIVMRVVFMILTFMYLIFSIIVVKQVKLMTDTIQLRHEQLLIFISYMHMMTAFIAFLFTVFML